MNRTVELRVDLQFWEELVAFFLIWEEAYTASNGGGDAGRRRDSGKCVGGQ